MCHRSGEMERERWIDRERERKWESKGEGESDGRQVRVRDI